MKLLDDIMAYVAENVNLDETLVIVTADHSHSFEVTGRIGRFQNILGLDQVYSNYVSGLCINCPLHLKHGVHFMILDIR